MIQKTVGIILHTTNFKDSDVIVKIYTKKFGIVSFIVQNVKSTKAKIKPSFLQGLTILELSFENIPSKGLQKIVDASIHFHTPSISNDIQKTSLLYFMNEVLYKSIKEEEENQKLFDFIFDKITQLEHAEKLYFFSVQFLIQLTYHLGFFPNNNYDSQHHFFDMVEGIFLNSLPSHPYVLNPEESAYLSAFIDDNFTKEMDRTTRNSLVNKLLEYYKLHISNFGNIKSIKVLNEVFE